MPDISDLKTMTEQWEHFESVDIDPRAPDVQRHEMRRAFYAGASSMLLLITTGIRPCPPALANRILELNQEIKTYLRKH